MACLARAAFSCGLTLLVGARPGADPRGEGWPHLAEVGAALADPAPEQGLARLDRLGPEAAPALWAVLTGQALGELELDRAASRALARRALAGWPDEAAVAQLVAGLRPESGPGQRLELVELLSWTESRAALAAIFAVLHGMDPLQLRGSRVTSSLAAALEPVLLADERAFQELAERLPELEPALLPAVVEAVRGLRHPGAFLVLAELASHEPALESAVLAALGRGARRPVPEAAWRCVDLARRALTAIDPRQRRLAAVALGRLGDGDSFFSLVACLEDHDRVVRRCALEALQELSGIRRQWSAAQWRSWQEGEEAWLAASDALAAVLAHGDPQRAAEAAHEAARHRLFAERAAELLCEGLQHPQARIRALVCGLLERLEHARAIPALVDASGDPDAAVRAAARRALEALTGLDPGPGPFAWHDWHATR